MTGSHFIWLSMSLCTTLYTFYIFLIWVNLVSLLFRDSKNKCQLTVCQAAMYLYKKYLELLSSYSKIVVSEWVSQQLHFNCLNTNCYKPTVVKCGEKLRVQSWFSWWTLSWNLIALTLTFHFSVLCNMQVCMYIP